MAGLGAYGGANLTGGVQAAGTAANAANAANVAGADVLTAAGTNALEGAATALTPTQQFTTGAQNLFASGQGGEAARTAFMGNIGGVPGAIKTGLGVAASIPPPTQQAPKEEKGEVPQYTKSREGPMFPGADRAPGDSSEFSYFGPSQYTRTGTTRNPLTASSSGAGDPMALLSSLSDEERQRLGLSPLGMKQGGIAALARGRREIRKSMPPRFLSGGGDGMSDSIPAVINNKQPARLADGEFVIPADVVSHLGNGSSKAGAKKLYAMMDRLRKARTGKKRQAPKVNVNRMMPA
jgi:hypothetical protein